MTKLKKNKISKQGATANKSDPIRVLLADDHALMRQVLVDLIHSQKDFIVEAQASTGHEAIQMANRYKPHVVLMDVSMPVMNGIDATAQIRKKHPDICIIGLSLNYDFYTKEKMLSAGANAVLDKANSFDILYQKILGVTSIWLQKYRRCTRRQDREKLCGPIEADEVFIGVRNLSTRVRVGTKKTTVAGAV